MDNIKKMILEEEAKGNIVVADGTGLYATSLKDIIKEPIEGILYNLNRGKATVLTFLPDPKWINDYAVCKVITALKERITELEKQILLNK